MGCRAKRLPKVTIEEFNLIKLSSSSQRQTGSHITALSNASKENSF